MKPQKNVLVSWSGPGDQIFKSYMTILHITIPERKIRLFFGTFTIAKTSSQLFYNCTVTSFWWSQWATEEPKLWWQN